MKVHEYREMMRYLTRKPIDKEIAQAVDVKERVRETTPFYQKPKELVQDDKPAPQVDSVPLYQGVPSDVAIEEKMPVYFPPDMIRSMPVAPDLPYPPVQVELATGGRVGFKKAGLAAAEKVLERGAIKFTQKQIDSPISGEAAKLEGDNLMKWIKKQYDSKNYNDINFYKAIEKYKNEELGGNLFRFWEESGLSRNNIEKSLARRRNFKFTTLGPGLKSEIVKDIDTPYNTVKEMTDAIKKGEFNIEDRINSLTKKGVIEKNKFYNSYDLAKILGVSPDKKEVDNITQLFTVGKKGPYQRGVRGGEDIPFEQGERKNIFKYRPEDVAGNIQKFGEEKVIFGTGNQAAAARRKLEMEIDPEFVNYKENFKKRRSTLLNSEHPDFVEIAIKRNVDSGLNYDIGHPVPLALIEKHDFLQTPKNIKKFHSISDFTIQDDRINRKILVGKDEAKEISKKYRVGFQAEEDRLLIELGNFLKNKEGKKATQEDINFINQWNKKSKELYKEKFETVKNFVDDKKDVEPYLKGQEYTTLGFKFDLKPGQNINADNLQLDKSYFKTDKSFGNIASIAPDAQTFNDLTPKQKAQFHTNVINQYGDYIGNVAKASNVKGKAPAFNKEDIQDFKDTLVFGTNENKGLIDYKNLMYGVGTPFAVGVGVDASGYGDEVNKEILNIFEKKPITEAGIISGVKEAVQENPITSGAAAVTSPLLTEKGRDIYKKVGTGALDFVSKVATPLVVGLEGYRMGQDFEKGVPFSESLSGVMLMDEPIRRQKILNRMGDDARLLVKQTKGMMPEDGLDKLSMEEIDKFYSGLSLKPDLNLIQKYKDASAAQEAERAIVAQQREAQLQKIRENFPEQKEIPDVYATGGMVEPKDDLYIPALPKSDSSIREGVLNLAFGGRVNFSGGGGAIKLARMITDVLDNLRQKLFMPAHTQRTTSAEAAKKLATSPYTHPTNQSPQSNILEDIEKSKSVLPKEYHSILDDIKKDVENFDYATASNRADALNKEIPDALKFEKLSKDLFPMEDPLNNAFIIFDPKRDKMMGRYTQKISMDPETGRGIRQTYDTWDSKNKRFYPEGEEKLMGVESLEKGKEGLN